MFEWKILKIKEQFISNCPRYLCGEDYKYYLLHDNHKFNGTLVGVRLNKYEIQNIYDLIDFPKLDAYKLGVIDDY